MMNAGITPDQIDYVNAHGTGTEANDQIETLAMKKVFSDVEKVLISSTKSYFGHNIGLCRNRRTDSMLSHVA